MYVYIYAVFISIRWKVWNWGLRGQSEAGNDFYLCKNSFI